MDSAQVDRVRCCRWPRARLFLLSPLLLLGAAQALGQASPAVPAASTQTPPAAEPPLEDAAETDLFKLDEALNAKVVTAGGVLEERSLAAADVTVVNSDEIALHGWRSLAEVLSNVPGLYVVDDLVLPSVGVRGVSGGLNAGTRIVKIMINGVAVNFRPDLSAFIGPEFIPMEVVERVEIAKGPLSALYGANAFLAVVNVITKQPVNGVNAEVAGRGELIRTKAGYGASAMLSYDADGVSFLGAVSADRIDRSGLSLSRTFAAQDPSLPRYAPFFTGQSSTGDLSNPLSAYGQLSLGKAEKLGALVIQGGMQQLDSMGEFQLNSVLTNQSRIALQNFWMSARYDKKLTEQLQIWAQVGYSSGAPMLDYRLFVTDSNTASYQPNDSYDAWDFAAEADYTFGPELSLKLGFDAELDRETVLYYSETLLQSQGNLASGTVLPMILSTENLHQDLNDAAVYLQATSVPFAKLPGLHLTGNLRLDKPNLFATQFSWRAAVAYRFNDQVTAKLIAGRAFQAPSGVLLFAQNGFGEQGDIIGARSQPGLPSLQPQISQSVELGVASRFLSHFGLEGGLYAQEVDDRISFRPDGTSFVASNGTPGATDYTAQVEQNVGLELVFHAFLGRFSPYCAGSFQQSILGGQISAQPPPLYPNIFGRVGTNVALPEAHLLLNAQVRGVGDRGSSDSNTQFNSLTPYTLPAYADVDLSVATVDLHLIGGDNVTQVRVAVYDLFDERHFEPGFGGFDIPNLGRTVAAELRQQF